MPRVIQTWDRTQVPDPVAFQRWIHGRNLSLMLNVHDQCGYDACQRGYAEARAAVPSMARLASNATVPCEFENAGLQAAWFEHNLESGENAGIDSWWTDLGDMSTHGNYSVDGAYTWAPGTYVSGFENIFSILATLSWMFVGIRQRGPLPSPICA